MSSRRGVGTTNNNNNNNNPTRSVSATKVAATSPAGSTRGSVSSSSSLASDASAVRTSNRLTTTLRGLLWSHRISEIYILDRLKQIRDTGLVGAITLSVFQLVSVLASNEVSLVYIAFVLWCVDTTLGLHLLFLYTASHLLCNVVKNWLQVTK